MGFEVDKLSKILIKTSNVVEYIESNIQNIETLTTDDPIIYCMRKHTYMIFLREFLKLFKYLASSSIHTISIWLDLFFKALPQESKRIMERILTRLI